MHWAVAIALGLVLLVVGAEWLVRGASTLAARLRVSRLIIGLTIVAYGTSSPEMAVSVLASLRGQADVALGNVVGSNLGHHVRAEPLGALERYRPSSRSGRICERIGTFHGVRNRRGADSRKGLEE